MENSDCTNFIFHNIVSKNVPAARFNNSTTNISELMGFIMKSNGSWYANMPQFVKQCIQLYNSHKNNILELMEFIMKSNGSQYANVSQFLNA